MSTVRAWLVPTVSVAAARWTQFVAGRPRLGKVLAPVMRSRLATLPARPSAAQSDGCFERCRPIHFPQRGRGDAALDDLPRPGTDEFDDLVTSSRRRRRVILRSGVARAPWAADAVAALGAAGVPMSWSGARHDLPGELGQLGDVVAGDPAPGHHGRELHSIRVRRAAQRYLDQRSGRVEATGVSVLLASKRPEDIDRAVGFVARQRDVHVQLLVGLHGPDWTDGAAQRIEATGPPDTAVLRFEAEQSLGELLAALTRRARHDLVAKWDDDDWYGDDHLGDLCRAYRYSGADVVGKAAEFVYLEQSDVTTRRFAFGAESYGWTLAGGTLLTSGGWLERVGGWQPVARGVDRELLAATRRAGGSAYRTHGFQYVLRRRGGAAHTWAAPDTRFLAAATDSRPGLDLAFADVEEPS